MINNIQKGRALLVLFLLALGMLVMSGCGGAAAPTAAPTDTPVAATPTEVPVPTVAAEVVIAPTEALAAASPAGSTLPNADGSGARATPDSSWKPGAHANSVPAPAKLVTAGTLTVGTYANNPPQEYTNLDGKFIGMDMDLAAEIANRLGLQLKIVNSSVDDLISSLNAGELDIIISAMPITDESKKVVDFVPYFMVGQTVMVQKGNTKGIKTLDDLSGKSVLAQQGTKGEKLLSDLNNKFATEGKPKVNVTVYPSDIEVTDQLRAGNADASIHDMPVAAYYTKESPDFDIVVLNYEPVSEGIAIAQNNKPMSDAVNAILIAMKDDGGTATIKGKWGACEELEFPKP